jgi:ABC-type branched-subunit amino acid transport system ATPase component
MADGGSALQVRGLSRRFGGVAAIDALDLDVQAGETLGVIGPNGAGKSTLINLISGGCAADAGSITLYGTDITALRADARTRLGVGRTYQIPRPFARLSVYENLELAARHARRSEAAARVAPESIAERCRRILARTGLADVADAAAGSLPLLRRKRLELARALALQPRLLLLDEIGAGLIERETRALIELIIDLKHEIGTIVLIEHVMDVIQACCQRTAVLTSGRLLTIGATREVLADAQVAAVYLGTGERVAEQSGAPAPGPAPAPAAAVPPVLLTVRGADVHYGGVRALRQVSLELRAGECVALLGANGAGKTTLARAISGAVPLAAGTIEFAGTRINGLAAERVTALGIGHCMEGRKIFSSLSVEENLLLAVPPAAQPAAAARLQRAYAMFPALRERRAHAGTAMSGGQQQMLAIARALMSEPRLVIFDEVSLGLAPIAVASLYESLARIRTSGVAMLIVEQNIHRGLQLADRAYVLAHGEIRLSGTPLQIRTSRELRALYVGEDAASGAAAPEA